MEDWKNIILTTVDLKEDYDILDIVNVTVAGNTWKDEAKHLGIDIDTGWLAAGDVSVVFQVASSSLKHRANELGADEFDVGFDNYGPYVVGFGTAVKLK